ncbi:MAG: hypothetical protein GXY51_00125 [Bacteroidetes bacterium]|nr:hypothetical protein [Bacteroidota bacterium]
MNFRSLTIILIFFTTSLVCKTQSLNDSVLMTIEGKDISAGEFIRMYEKSHETGQMPDIEDYLEQYVIFRLKVAEAIDKGLDTTASFRNELEGYRTQLAQNYLTDPGTKEELLKKTYERSRTEISAWHVLIECPAGSSPHDTLLAWEKALDVRERILRGESFEQVAKSTSDDPSARLNGGYLGYFTVFQMITPFEDAAYKLKKGTVSQPVKTPYGYHIIRVTDRRPAKGKVLVAHIMKASPPGTSEEDAVLAERTINNIYKELTEGKPFTELVEKHSDHKESASREGRLDWFGTGEIIHEFAEAAFSLTDTGLFTKPVKTIYGWHIIKLLDKKAPGSFEETRSFLESRINQSHLNTLSKRSFINTLKKEYDFRIDKKAFNWFVSHTDTMIIKGISTYNRKSIPSGNIYTFADQQLTTNEFASFVETRKSIIPSNDPATFINQSIDALAADQIMKYENSILEKKYPEFRYLMKEFHDGILLFEISEETIWNRVHEDTSGLKRFYEEHKYEYMTKRSIEGKLYTLRISDGKRKLSSALRKYSRKKNTDQLMIERFNKNNDSVLIITEKKCEEGDDPLIDKISWKKGKQYLEINNYPSFIMINNIIEPTPEAFENIQGEMIATYQEYLEKEWIRQLREKYAVKIYDHIFDKVKESLVNE